MDPAKRAEQPQGPPTVRDPIREARLSDAEAIAAIYNHYVLHTVVTFEEEPVSGAAMEERMRRVAERFPWLVHEEGGEVLGYSYAAPWQVRSAYRYTAESTVYLREDVRGRGIGRPLYAALLARVAALGAHVAVGGIALPNPASVALHERLGFRKTAHMPEVGRKFERWIDVGWWALRLPPA